jgi:hypothetical protein
VMTDKLSQAPHIQGRIGSAYPVNVN